MYSPLVRVVFVSIPWHRPQCLISPLLPIPHCLRDWILSYDRRTGLFYHFNTRTGQSEWALEEEEEEEEGEHRGGEETALCRKKVREYQKENVSSPRTTISIR